MTTENQVVSNFDQRLNIFLVYILWGIVGWAVGIVFFRMAGALFQPDYLWVLFLLTIPTAWLFVQVIGWANKIDGLQLLYAVVCGNFIACCLDGLAIAFFPSIYNLDPMPHLWAAAFLLWFVGATLGWAIIATRRG